jgi:DNA gyrase/topoisomerase IV subunit B
MGTKRSKSSIVDDEFTKLKDDIDKLQKSPTLYISFRGEAGTEQLCHEMFNNMVDEHRNKNTLSDGTMKIFLDGETGMIYFTDTGRGINFDDLEDACTVLQAGTKMDRATGGASGGEYGVGLTATNALSEQFEITSTREGKSRFLKFINGRKVEDRTVDIDPKLHGLSVGFKPSKAFLGEDAAVPLQSFSEWLKRTVFTLEPNIQITFTATDVDGKETFREVYQNEDGNVGGFIPAIVGTDIGYLMKEPVVLHNAMTLMETNIPVKTDNEDGTVTIEMTERERMIAVEFAFNYSPKIVEPRVYGFTNMIEQMDGGVHVNALKSVLSSVIYEKIAATQKKNETPVIADDALTGLVGVVNLNTTMSTGFESQTKHKLGNRKFIEPLKKLYKEAVEAYFETVEGKKEFKRITDFVKLNARIRTNAANERKKVKTSLPSLMDSKLIGNYVAANLIGTPKEDLPVKLEVFIVEGDSAGGQARKARFNPDYQGILNFTGKPDNYYSTYRLTHSANLPAGNVYAVLLDKVLGCGYGSHFNEDNLIYDKIIYAFDADIDGEHMAGITLSSTYALAPDLILHGHCYRVLTPLYKVAESQAAANKMSKTDINADDYVYTKSELFDRFERNVVKYARIKFTETDDYISNDNMRRFLVANREYYQVLDEMSMFESIPKEILEFIAATPDFDKHIKELDPELNYSDGSIYGCYKGDFVAINLNKTLMDKIQYLTKVIERSNDGIYQYEFYDRRGENSNFNHVDRLTIGQIMELCQKYSPYIVNRYKGLGEMSKYEMWKFAMNPNYRRLVRYTVSDVQRFESTLDDLFVMNPRGRRIRKQLVQSSNLSLDEIDN